MMKKTILIRIIKIVFVLAAFSFLGLFLFYFLSQKKFEEVTTEGKKAPQWLKNDITNIQLVRDDRACDPLVYQSALGEVFDGFLAEMEKEDHTQYWYRVKGRVKDVYKDAEGQTFILLDNSPDPLSIKVTKPDISEYPRITEFDELGSVEAGDEVSVELVSGCKENEQLWLKTYTFHKF